MIDAYPYTQQNPEYGRNRYKAVIKKTGNKIAGNSGKYGQTEIKAAGGAGISQIDTHA